MSDDLLHDRPYETSGKLLRASPIRKEERTLEERVADALPWLDELAEAHSTRAAKHASLLREQQAEIERLTMERDLACGEIDAAWAERDSLRRDLEEAMVELADRREHMRRNIMTGVNRAIDLSRARGEG